MTEEKKNQSANNAEEKKEEKAEPVKEEKNVKEESAKEESTPQAEEETVEVPKKFEELVKNIEGLTVLELSELVKILEKKFGVSAAAPVAAAPAAGSASSEEGGADSGEKSEYTVELKEAGDKKIEVIKAVRTITNKGLKEAKDLVDGVSEGPQVIKEGVPTEEAKEAEKTLKEAGAVVELK